MENWKRVVQRPQSGIVASATTQGPPESEEHKNGWVALRVIGEQLAVPLETVQQRWVELSAALK